MGVNNTNALYDKFLPSWKKCNDCYEGEETVKIGREKYLPKLTGQLNDEMNGEISDYDLYLQRARYYNYTKKVVDSFNEMLYRKNVVINVPPECKKITDKFTCDGKSLLTSLKECTKKILLNYRVGLLLDFPNAMNSDIAYSKADVERMNIRPYGVYYDTANIINWRYQVVNNVQVLQMVVLVEDYEDKDDNDDNNEFNTRTKKRYRVLDLYKDEFSSEYRYRVRLFYQVDGSNGTKTTFISNDDEEIFPMVKNKYLDYIPFYFITSKGISNDLDYSIINDIVDINLGHYINSADYENALHITASPTPVVIGYSNVEEDGRTKAISLGSNKALMLYGSDADAKYLEYKGDGVGSIRDAMAKKGEIISALAGKMLDNDPNGVESAETAKIRKETEHSMLQSMALSLSIAYKYILAILCEWQNINGDIEIRLNTDYDISDIDASLLGKLNEALNSNAISRKTYYDNLRRYEMYLPDWSYEEEMDAIAKDIIEWGDSMAQDNDTDTSDMSKFNKASDTKDESDTERQGGTLEDQANNPTKIEKTKE